MHGDRFGAQPPEWFQTLEVARYLRISPTELERMPVIYYRWAVAAMNAKGKADEYRRSKKGSQ